MNGVDTGIYEAFVFPYYGKLPKQTNRNYQSFNFFDMARGQRKDVDYFPHECNHGRKMNIIEAKYGNDGYAAWFKLLEQLGKANNHYINLQDDTNLMFLASIFRLSEQNTLYILADLAKLGAINRFLYEQHQIVWSEKFVESIKDAYRQRAGLVFQYSDVLNELGIKNIQSSGGYPPTEANTAVSIPKEENSKEKERKEKEILDGRKLKFALTLEPFLPEYGRPLIKDFYDYWTEPTTNGKKFRQELQKTWSLERRLKKWLDNEPNFKKEKSSAQKEKEPTLIGRQTAETVQNNYNAFMSHGE